MPGPIRVLIVEDSPDDADLLVRELARGGFEPSWRRVETAEEMRAALAAAAWDVVLCDFTLPQFGAEAALQLARRSDPDLPFVVVSGTVEDEKAIEVLRGGAGDYVLKRNLLRLPHAVAREVREAENRRRQRLAEAHNRDLAALVESSQEAIIGLTLDGVVTSWNGGAERLFGYPAAEMVGRNVAALAPPEWAGGQREVLARVGRGERPEPFEAVRLRRDGSPVEVAVSIAPVPDEAGRAVGAVKVVRDLSGLKRAEAAARRSAELLRAVADGAADAIFVKDRDGRYLLFNQAAANFVGVPAEAVIGKDDRELFDPEGARLVLERDRHVMESGRTETREETLSAGGVTRTYLATKGPLRDAAGRVVGLLGISRDISDRKRAEERLRASEARFRALVEKSFDAIVLLDAAGSILYGSPGAERIGGRPLEVYLGRPMGQWVHPDDLPRLVEGFREVLERPGHSVSLASRFRHADGSWRCVEATHTNLLADPNVGAVVVNFRDVTDRKRAEAERDGLLRRLQLQVERMPIGLVGTAPDLTLTDWNPAAERIFGFRRAEVLGKTCFDLFVPPAARPGVEDILRRLLAGDMTAHGVTENRTRDGRAIFCEWYNTPLVGPDGAVGGILSMVVDVTGRRQLEEQYRQAQKMEAVGRLAGGVAHDFNNLLTVINGYSELVLQGLAPDDPNRPLVQEIHRAGERSAALTRQLLVFSRKQVVQPRLLDLNEVVADAEKLLRRLIGEDVRLTTELHPLAGQVLADAGQLEQVLLNLAVNARDAMPTGGTLTIATADADRNGCLPGPAGAEGGPWVLLAVTDTGTGMTEEVKARLFEPFFTTKGVGKGTGLGLAVVHGIVQQAGGHVAVDSAPGRGTTFRVYLPRVESSARPAPPAPAARAGPTGTETLLLVEDEAGVRALARQVLVGCGYRVLEAADGEEALGVAGQQAGPIHLLVSDVVMPGGLGGRELAERLLALHPEARVLYISGYTDDAVVRHGVREEHVAFLQKPFSPVALAFKVREVLDAPDRTL